jgi:hypothetical protein
MCYASFSYTIDVRKALSDLQDGKDPWTKYFLATFYGHEPIDKLWIHSIISKVKRNYKRRELEQP